MEDHVEVGAFDLFPLLRRHVEELADDDHAGHETGRVEPAESIECPGDQRLVALGRREIDVADGFDRCAERLELRHLLVERLLDTDHAAVAGGALEHQVVAAFGHRACQRGTHVAGGHRDQGNRT